MATAYALWLRRAAFVELLDASWQGITLMAALVVVGWVLSAAQSWLLFRAERTAIGFGENLVMALSANFANYLPMRAGSLLRGRYMKQIHGLRYMRFGSVFGIRMVLLAAACGTLGTIGALGLTLQEGRPVWLLAIGFTVVTVMSVGALALEFPQVTPRGRLGRLWNDFVNGFAAARAQPKVSLLVFALTVAQQLALGMRLLIGFEAFEVQTSVWFLLLLAPVVIAISFIAITPGGLGLREAAIGYVAFATGYDFDLGLFAGSLDRAVILGLAILFGAPSFIWMWARLQRRPIAQPDPPLDSHSG